VVERRSTEAIDRLQTRVIPQQVFHHLKIAISAGRYFHFLHF